MATCKERVWNLCANGCGIRLLFFFLLVIRCPEPGEPTDAPCGVQSLDSGRVFSQP